MSLPDILYRLGFAALLWTAPSGCGTATTAATSSPASSQPRIAVHGQALLAASEVPKLKDSSQLQFAAYAKNAEDAIKLFESVGDEVSLGKAAGNAGDAYRGLHDYPKALRFYGEASRSGGRTSCLTCVALAEEASGEVLVLMGRPAEARVHLIRSAELFELSNLGLAAASSWLTLGSMHLGRRELEAADKAFGRAEALYRSSGDPEYEAKAIVGKAETALRRGDDAAAAAELRRALQIQRGLKFRMGEVASQALLAEMGARAGGADRAHALLADAEAALEREGSPNFRGHESYRIAQAFRRLGRADIAVARMRNAAEEFDKIGVPLGRAAAEIAIAEMFRDTGNVDAVQRYATAIQRSWSRHNGKEDLAVKLDIMPLARWQVTAKLLTLEGWLRLQERRVDIALVKFQQAEETYRSEGAFSDAAETARLTGTSLRDAGRAAEAAVAFRRALDGFREVGDAGQAAEVEDLLRSVGFASPATG